MTRLSAPRRASSLALLGALVLLPGCNTAERLANGGDPPLSQIEDPMARPGYKPVSMPMPTPQATARNPNSLWRNGARAFFKDQRAAQVGDMLTVVVNIADNADMNNTNSRNRGTTQNPNSETLGVPNLANYIGAAQYATALGGADASKLASVNSSSHHEGDGVIKRNEAVNLKLTATVLQTLPNGNMVITGKQQVKVNAEMRELSITGIVRPEDIDSTNSIGYERIAEARISYGGQGYISDVQKPRYGQELLDIILPF